MLQDKIVTKLPYQKARSVPVHNKIAYEKNSERPVEHHQYNHGEIIIIHRDHNFAKKVGLCITYMAQGRSPYMINYHPKNLK